MRLDTRGLGALFFGSSIVACAWDTCTRITEELIWRTLLLADTLACVGVQDKGE